MLIAQRGSVFPWMTVRRNLLFGAVQPTASEREELMRRYIELVGLEGFEESFPRSSRAECSSASRSRAR